MGLLSKFSFFWISKMFQISGTATVKNFYCFLFEFNEDWWSCSYLCVLKLHQVLLNSNGKQKGFFNDTFLMNGPSIKGMWICPLKISLDNFIMYKGLFLKSVYHKGEVWVSIIVLPFQRKMNVLKEQLSFWASTIFGSLNTNIVMPINIYKYLYLYTTYKRPI